MAVATDRTARYGGASSTFTTAASPGASITALKTAVTTALTTAGWTSMGGDRYSSPGESGTEFLFLYVASAGNGTASGVMAPSGGSYLLVAPLQWGNGSGNYCNQLGTPVLATASHPKVPYNVLSLTASTTYEYAIVADKDGICVVCSPSGSATESHILNTGIGHRIPGARATFTSTGTITGTPTANLTVNLSGNPIAAGYRPGDIIMIVGQQVGQVTATLGDIISTKIVSLTTSSVTLDYVAALSGTLAAGTLLGEDPQPYIGLPLIPGTGSNPYSAGQTAHCAPVAGQGITEISIPPPGSGFNLWAYQISGTGTGDMDGNQSGTTIGLTAAPLLGSSLASVISASDNRTKTASGVSYITRPTYVVDGINFTQGSQFTRGAFKYLYQDTRTSSFASTGAFAKDVTTKLEEWVAVNYASVASFWMGPFPLAHSTNDVIRKILPADEMTPALYLLDDLAVQASCHAQVIVGSSAAAGATTEQSLVDQIIADADAGGLQVKVLETISGVSSDDEQPMLVDHPLDFQSTSSPSVPLGSNYNQGHN